MARRMVRRLVIDASVVRAAGGEGATFPTSMHCRDFLAEVLLICHRALLTEELSREWEEHQSQFALRWRTAMQSKGKLVEIGEATDGELRDEVEVAAQSERAGDVMRKDIHLIEAALHGDHVVVSLDEEARAVFGAVSRGIRKLRRVSWVNPADDPADTLDWLRAGARAEASRRL